MLMVSNAAEPGCAVANELWPAGCQSWVSATWPKPSARRLMTGTTASPSPTASAPPGQKSFCTSMIKSTSSSRVCIRDLRQRGPPEVSAKPGLYQQGIAAHGLRLVLAVAFGEFHSYANE